MEKLRLFAVSSVTEPPVELIRGKGQILTCTLTLPLPPQLLVFNQGQWPAGEDKNITLDICLDSEKIGKMGEDTKCFTWQTDSLEGRPAGEKILLEMKVMGMKTPAEPRPVPKGKKRNVPKKMGKASSAPEQKTEPEKKQPLGNISEYLNADTETIADSDNLKTREKPKGKKTPQDGGASNSEKAKPKKRKNDAFPSSTAAKKKSVLPTTSLKKKTRQTQLSFAGVKKVMPMIVEPKKDDEQDAISKNESSTDLQATTINVDEKDSVTDHPKLRLDISPKQTQMDHDGRCEAQILNETTPQMPVMPSPLPRKPTKKRLRSDVERSSDGPTPKKRGSRMRALTSEGTPKSSRSKIILGDDPFKENIKPVQDIEKATLSNGRLTRCVDLSARAPRPSARWGHTMLLSQPRCAVLIGGQGDRQQLSRDSVWTLHTETRKWQCEEVQSEGQKPENRMGHTATFDPVMRCIYIFGGSKNSRWFHDVHIYDLDENRWTLAKVNGKAPTRAYHTTCLHRHELWVFGGVYPRPDPNPDGCSNDIHIFSPVMQSWYTPIVQGDKPLARSGHSATLIKDRMVMFGGWDAPFCYNDLFILDLTTVDWSKPDVKGTPPKPRSWHASCALSNQRILIHGGYDGNEALEDSFIFDLDGLSWSRLVVPNTPKARAGHAAVCVPYNHENQEDDEVLVFGGGDNDGEFFYDLLSFTIPFNPVVEI